MPRLSNKKLAAKAVASAVRKAAKKGHKPPSDAKVTAAFNRATSP